MTDRSTNTSVAEQAREHLIQPWESLEKLGEEARIVIDRAEGIYLFDESGRRMIDGPAGMWCVQMGYGRREIAEAMTEQALRLAYNTPWYSTNSPAAALAKRIARMTPGDLDRVFFTASGSAAVDSALRFVQFYNNRLGRPEKKLILSRPGAYHGSTYLSASCSGKSRHKSEFDFHDEARIALSDPAPSRRPEGVDEADFLGWLGEELESVIRALGPDRVAAFIAEPVQASGGVIIAPAGYHAMCLEICRRHDVIYISDEVVTAFGRMGHWFASHDVFGITPDIITFAKGVTSGYAPLGGFAISGALLERVSGSDQEGSVFANGFTYSGHPVCCAAALANIELMEREAVLEHVREVAPVFRGALEGLADLPLVHDVRCAGLMVAVECRLPDGYEADEEINLGALIDRHSQDRGLFLRPLGNACVLSPPLVSTADQLREIADILRASIAAVARDRGIPAGRAE